MQQSYIIQNTHVYYHINSCL